MYNMLQNKEEELKKNIAEVKRTFDELENKKEEVKKEILSVVPPTASGIEMARKKNNIRTADKVNSEKNDISSTVRKTTRPVTKKNNKDSDTSGVPSTLVEIQKENSIEHVEGNEDNKTGKILELYQQKKSVLEISKALGLGQGEVKLVIDLYGKN